MSQVCNQVIPEGYKQTEIDVIPNDWSVKAFGQVMHIRHGKDQKTIQVIDGQYPIFGTGGKMGTTNTPIYDKPSVLIGRKGTINKPRYIATPFWTVDTLFYSEINKDESAKFIYYKFCMIDWMQYNEASGVPSLNSSTIESVVTSFPKFDEQTAIANALSDVDALLTELQNLISKKQAIKIATMQQLLTGKTRLPEFAYHQQTTATEGTLGMKGKGKPKGTKPSELGEIPEDWEVIILDEAANFLDGQRRPIKSGDRAKIKGQYPYYGASGIVDYVNDFIFDGEFILLGEDGENILSRSLPLAFKASGKIWVNNHAHVMTPKQSFHIDFLIPYLESLDYALLNSGTAQPKLNKQSCLNIKVIKPSIEEQNTIATILTDMDKEIQTLEQRLTKIRQIKQGMMQELLTGRTRLPVYTEEK